MKNIEKESKRRTLPASWVITIDGVVIPQNEYDWTDDGNFYFQKTLIELAQTYCSIHKNYQEGDVVEVSMRMDWTVELL